MLLIKCKIWIIQNKNLSKRCWCHSTKYIYFEVLECPGFTETANAFIGFYVKKEKYLISEL